MLELNHLSDEVLKALSPLDGVSELALSMVKLDLEVLNSLFHLPDLSFQALDLLLFSGHRGHLSFP